MFGQTADAIVRIKSSRELSQVTATLEQLGWVVAAPEQNQVVCGIDHPEQTHKYSFRIQLDSSFIPGDGNLGIRITDVDDLSILTYLEFEFMHSPPEISVNHQTTFTQSSLIEILVEMQDADGIDAVCSAEYSQNGTLLYFAPNSTVTDLDGTGVWSTSWLLPNYVDGVVDMTIQCVDWSSNEVEYTSQLEIESNGECVENCSDLNDAVDDSKESYIYQIAGGIAVLIIVLLISSMYIRGRSKTREEDSWVDDSHSPEPVRDERIPEGWTVEEFLNWLDGPMPEDWNAEQWEQYREGMEDLR